MGGLFAALTTFCRGADRCGNGFLHRDVVRYLSLISHLFLEQTIWPEGLVQWLAVFGLGFFPVGAAFYVWDYGVKRGNIQVLGASSYAAPLLSTLVLIIAGVTEPTRPGYCLHVP